MDAQRVLQVRVISAQTNFHFGKRAPQLASDGLLRQLGVVEHQGQGYWDAEAIELIPDVHFVHARKWHKSNYYFQVLVAKNFHSLGQFVRNIRSGMDNMGGAVTTRFNAMGCYL